LKLDRDETRRSRKMDPHNGSLAVIIFAALWLVAFIGNRI
jgi:hypothetical protein